MDHSNEQWSRGLNDRHCTHYTFHEETSPWFLLNEETKIQIYAVKRWIERKLQLEFRALISSVFLVFSCPHFCYKTKKCNHSSIEKIGSWKRTKFVLNYEDQITENLEVNWNVIQVRNSLFGYLSIASFFDWEPLKRTTSSYWLTVLILILIVGQLVSSSFPIWLLSSQYCPSVSQIDSSPLRRIPLSKNIIMANQWKPLFYENQTYCSFTRSCNWIGYRSPFLMIYITHCESKSGSGTSIEFYEPKCVTLSKQLKAGWGKEIKWNRIHLSLAPSLSLSVHRSHFLAHFSPSGSLLLASIHKMLTRIPSISWCIWYHSSLLV